MSYTVRFAPAARDQLDASKTTLRSPVDFPSWRRTSLMASWRPAKASRPSPERGTRRDDLLSGLRVTNYRKSTTAAFRVDTDARADAIIGVFYGGQDYEAALSAPEH